MAGRKGGGREEGRRERGKEGGRRREGKKGKERTQCVSVSEYTCVCVFV